MRRRYEQVNDGDWVEPAEAFEQCANKIARAICQEECAYRGEPACWHVLSGEPAEWVWPNPNCNEPGCMALARASMEAVAEPAVISNICPQGPTFHWKDGWMFARGEAGEVHVWKAEENRAPKIELKIPRAEWDSITAALARS